MKHKFVGHYECGWVHSFFDYSFGIEMADDSMCMGFVGAI